MKSDKIEVRVVTNVETAVLDHIYKKPGNIASNNAYLNFVREVLSANNNPYFPVIHRVIMFTTKKTSGLPRTGEFVVEMERLECFDNNPGHAIISEVMENIIRQTICESRKVVNEVIRHCHFGGELNKQEQKFIRDAVYGVKRAKTKSREGTYLDCHEGNFMRRKSDNRLVIIDPIANE